MEVLSLTESYAKEKDRFIRDCTLCGICVEACPAIPYTPLCAAAAPDVVGKMRDVFEHGRLSEEAAAKAASCTGCGLCRDVCPEGINPWTVQKALQVELLTLGQKRYPTMEVRLGDRTYFMPDIVASMQIKPGEERWMTRVPDRPPQKEVVVFTGCAMVMMPEKMFIVSDIMEKLGLDFVLLAGGELCCGDRYSSVNAGKADAHGRALVTALSAFKPREVVFCCASCTYRVSQHYQELASAPFHCDEIFHFLSQRTDQLGFTHPIEKTVTLHDPCAMTRLFGDTTSLRQLLRAIPGLKLVEMHQNKEKGICCGSGANRYFPKVGQEMTRQCLEGAARTGAEVLVDACQGCHLQFSPEESKFPFEIRNCLTLIGEAMGIRYEDKMRAFYRYANADRIIAEAGENVEAGPYHLDLVANLAKRMFEKEAR